MTDLQAIATLYEEIDDALDSSCVKLRQRQARAPTLSRASSK